MAYRQRTIPVTSKEEIQVQTDVRLIESNLIEEALQSQQTNHHTSHIHLEGSYSEFGLLRPFTDHFLLQEFATTIKDLRGSEYCKEKYEKRLQILQGQIHGLLKRDVLIHGECEGSNRWTSYYSTLNQKQKIIIKLENEKAYSDVRTRQLRERVKSLQLQVEGLSKSLVGYQKSMEENKILSHFYEKVTSLVEKGSKKGLDLQLLISEQIVPLVADFSFNLASITRTINRDFNNKNPIKESVINLAKEFDRLLKEQAFDESKLQQTINNLLFNFKAVKGVQHMKNQFDLALKTEEAESNYKNMLSLVKSQIENLKNQVPNLKGVERFQMVLNRLDVGVPLINCKGWINLVTTEYKTLQIDRDEKQLRELIGTLGGQFKRLFLKFPQIKTHLSGQLITIIESDVLGELIQGGSIDRLKQIVVQEVSSITVDNVYKYESSKEREIIFHLRVLIKGLLDEFERAKRTCGIEIELDAGICNLLRDQIIDGVDIEAIIALYRPHRQYIEVPVIVERPIYETVSFQKGIPIKTEVPLLLNQKTMQVVQLRKEVAVYIQKPIEHILVHNIPVEIQTQKVISVQVNKDLIVDRIVEKTTEQPVIYERAVALYEKEEVVRQIQIEKYIITDKNEYQAEKLVKQCKVQTQVVQRFIEKPCYIYQTKHVVREVDVKVPIIIIKPEYHEIEKIVNVLIEKKEIVHIIKEVAVEIRIPEIRIVELVEYRDKIIITNQVNQVVKEIQLTKEKEVVREVPKEIYIERSHFIKGDQVQIIKEVVCYIDKPIIHEILTCKNLEIQKIVPCYITEQVPIFTEIHVPCYTETVRELQVQKCKIIPITEEKIKQVIVEKHVPVIVEKQIIRIQKQIIEKIIEKIVQVPRVVEIEKIVQKIVVVPRIIEKIVEVPKIIEKIIFIEVPVLQIVEIQVPLIQIQTVEKIIQVKVENTVIEYVKQIEIVEVQKIVERIIQREKIIEVIVQKRIPYEVIREVAVPAYRDRIEYQKVYINDTKVESIEVQVPFNVPEIVPLVVERPIILEKIIQMVKIEKLVIDRPCPIINEVQKLVVHECIVEIPVQKQTVLEVPTDNIVYVKQVDIVEVSHQKIVKIIDTIEVPKEIYIQVEKVVYQIHDRLEQVPLNKIVHAPLLMEVPKIVNLVHYKEVAVEVPVREQRIKRDIFQQIKEVEVKEEIVVTVEVCRQKIKQITNEIKCFLTNECIKNIYSEVQVRSPTEYQLVQIQGQTIIQENNNNNVKIEIQERIIERVVQKIIMLPQIVEVVRNIHHISEINHLGIAVDVDINVQTEKYVGVSTELKKGLEELLAGFKISVKRQPQLKTIIALIDKYLLLIQDWICFPKLIEIPKEVIREVQRQRVVLVPTENKEKESILSYIVQKLITELRRIKECHKISLCLEQGIQRLFLLQECQLNKKLQTFQSQLHEKYTQNGQWNRSNPFLINTYINDHLNMIKLKEESNRIQEIQNQELHALRKELSFIHNKYNNTLCYNHKIYDHNQKLIGLLNRYRAHIDHDDYQGCLEEHKSFYQEIVNQHHTLSQINLNVQTTTTTQRFSLDIESKVQESGQGQEDISSIISKINIYQSKNQYLETQFKKVEFELHRTQEEVQYKNTTIRKLEIQIQTRINKLREEYSKNPNLNKQFLEENKKLQEKTRTLEKEINSQKQLSERARRQFQRSIETVKRQSQRDVQRRQRESRELVQKGKKEMQRQSNRLKIQLQKIKKEKERYELDLSQTKKRSSEQIKQIRQNQMSGANDKYNMLVTENIQLRKKYDQSQFEYEKFKKAALDNNNANENEIARLREESERLKSIKIEYDRQKKEGFMDLAAETQIVNKTIELNKRIKVLEAEGQKFKIRDENSVIEIKNLRQKLRILEAELESARREVESVKRESQSIQKSRMQSTTYQSGYKNVTTSIVENVQIGSGSVVRSPKSSGLKSGFQRGYVSPIESSLSREERIEQFGSQSSRVSQSSEEHSNPSYYKSQMTLREFIDAKHSDDNERNMYVTLVMIKVIQKIQEEVNHGIFNSYTPSSIYLSNFNVKGLDKLVVKFGASITNKNNKLEGLYLAPEVLGGALSTKKSTVFCLGIILDELIHGSTFFKSVDDIVNLQNQFKVREVRGEKLNPILKNTLFEMMNKEPSKRLEIVQAKRRLSLQKYITSEGRSSVTTTARQGRKLQE